MRAHVPLICVLTLFSSLFFGTLCIGAQIDKSELSEDIAYATWGDRGDRVKVVVSSLPAQLKNSDEFTALQISVGTATAGPELVFNHSNFALKTADGTQLNAAHPNEVATDQTYWKSVESLRRSRPLTTGPYFGGYNFVGSNFYDKNGRVWSGTHLNNGDYFRDVIFFPKPEDLSGVLVLGVMTAGMDKVVEVKLMVPKLNKKKKKG